MNRGHIYLEMWYWMLNAMEEAGMNGENTDAKNTVQMAFGQGVDETVEVQYKSAKNALSVANSLNEHIFAENIQLVLNSPMYDGIRESTAVSEAKAYDEVKTTCENCVEGQYYFGDGKNSHYLCPCCNGDWQHCPNCTEGTG